MVLPGALIEYAPALPPLALVFEFNPQSITRTRTVKLRSGSAPGTRFGYDFIDPRDTPRVAQGVTIEPETFTVKVLLDATDRMDRGEPTASILGIEPEVATLRSMVELKRQGPNGVQLLSNLGLAGERAFRRQESASVLIFLWGTHVLPVFLTGVTIEETAHLPTLIPYRATADLTMQVIETRNPFYTAERVRQVATAALNTGRAVAGPVFGVAL